MDSQLQMIVMAVKAIYDPTVSNENRIAASRAIEEMKEQSAENVERLAYALISENDLIVSHVGWNFLEHIIKFKWLELSPESRLSIRNGCFTKMTCSPMQSHELRVASARCIVAMIEHEWPQNWDDLFEQIGSIVAVSNCHAQIPFTIMQLLIEDVVALGTITNLSRRKDLQAAIVSNMDKIFQLIMLPLQEDSVTEEYLLLKRSALNLLSEIVEWVQPKILEASLDQIVRTVCLYLSTPLFSLYEAAAKCLWRLASRRRTKNCESAIVQSLFGDTAMRAILTATDMAARSEEHYSFLKVLCDVLSALGLHLADVWQDPPPNFDMYLAAIEAFTKHPSLYLKLEAVTVLSHLIEHAKIREDPFFNASVERVIIAMPYLIEKNGFPSKNNCETCHYSQLDYDDDNTFQQEYTRYRDRCRRLIRAACKGPHKGLLLKIVKEWIESRCFVEPHKSSSII